MKKDNAEMQPMGYGTSAKAPAGATASDKTGERMERVVNGVAMGKADATGPDHKFDGGRSKGVCYTHGRKSYQK
jgi:hypothetical protein